MGRNAQRRRAAGDPLRHLAELMGPLAVERVDGSHVTVAWDPDNPAHRRRVRRVKREAARLGYDVDLEED